MILLIVLIGHGSAEAPARRKPLKTLPFLSAREFWGAGRMINALLIAGAARLPKYT